MSTENHEQRIATLEKQLASVQAELVERKELFDRQVLELARFATGDHQRISTLLKVVISIPGVGDKSGNIEYLRQVAESERKLDQVEAALAQIARELKNPTPPNPPSPT